MLTVSRRSLLKSALGIAAAGTVLKSPAVLAQGAPLKLKFGNDLPVTHSVNVRLKEAIDAITEETKGQVAISLFPNNQLGSDTDMMTQLRSGALELATMPGTVLSTLIPTASLTGVGFAFTNYDKVWAAMDGEVAKFIRRAIEKVGLVPFEAV
jgi:TRAP-type C4-dicarboxylate transport system substrate-binding protein